MRSSILQVDDSPSSKRNLSLKTHTEYLILTSYSLYTIYYIVWYIILHTHYLAFASLAVHSYCLSRFEINGVRIIEYRTEFRSILRTEFSISSSYEI